MKYTVTYIMPLTSGGHDREEHQYTRKIHIEAENYWDALELAHKNVEMYSEKARVLNVELMLEPYPLVKGQNWDVPGYECLAKILNDAYLQAAVGKGAERHANALPFNLQPMQTISGLLKTNTGLAFQAIKKIQEAQGLPSSDRRIREYLGAINYIAGMIIFEQNNAQKEAPHAKESCSDAR